MFHFSPILRLVRWVYLISERPAHRVCRASKPVASHTVLIAFASLQSWVFFIWITCSKVISIPSPCPNTAITGFDSTSYIISTTSFSLSFHNYN
ncbi:uncharacterized protein CLUP02_14929 [Colletotrichum lupini]|uniref:Uncharacterized protein n=1 Tax=Colletotrichum lupini TaxID=145971 RepID=A0A9Q8T5I6_9PEZI|nr:uncharacterized protein CLUP02_14929 [Colletotrichum lupini]UQC89400.1 hypothetical protein CLUP02_14929 [Colletotrichum lupini]